MLTKITSTKFPKKSKSKSVNFLKDYRYIFVDTSIHIIRTIILMIITLLFFVSCNNSKNSNYQKTFQIIDSLSIYFPDTIPLYSNFNIYSWNYSDKYFSFLYDDSQNIVLYYYNFNDDQWKSTIFNRYGENGVLFKGRFCFINDSCIIYAPSYKKKVFEINITNSKIIKTYNYPSFYSISHQKHFKIYSDSEKLILPVSYTLGTDNLDSIKVKLSMLINKENDSCIFRINYPKHFRLTRNISYAKEIPEIIFQENMAILSFPTENQIYVYDYDSGSTKPYECLTSNNIKELIIKTNDNFKKAFLEELGGHHITILYDKYNKLYYRLSVSHPSFNGVLPNSNSDIQKLLNDYVVTISAIDTNFQVIASSDFNGLKLNVTHYFVNKKGLYIKSNFENENEMRFVHFDLVMN